MAQAARQIKKHLRRQAARQPVTARPGCESEIVEILKDKKRFPRPVRPVGSDSAATRCNRAAEGTLLRMDKMNRILSINAGSVTVQAGMRLQDLAKYLATRNLELSGGCDVPDRTVGGAVCSGSLLASIPGDAGHLSSIACSLTLITPQGRRMEIGENLHDLIRVIRLSYGLLGCVSEITLRTRPIRSYSIQHKRMDFAEFERSIPRLSVMQAGVRFYLLPFRNHVFVELRQYRTDKRQGRVLPWKIRDWVRNTALPEILRSVSRIIPIRRIRYPVIDGVSEATQILSNNTLVQTGSHSMEQTGRFRRTTAARKTEYCTWLFPASRFAAAVSAYREFCADYYRFAGFRCDLPAQGFCISRDDQSLLSPTFEGTVFAICSRSNQSKGWADFVLELADFAAQFDGIPVLNQTAGATAERIAIAYGRRLDHFRSIRRQLDPENRMLNPFFAETVG